MFLFPREQNKKREVRLQHGGRRRRRRRGIGLGMRRRSIAQRREQGIFSRISGKQRQRRRKQKQMQQRRRMNRMKLIPFFDDLSGDEKSRAFVPELRLVRDEARGREGFGI
jgi:hypothetical protein